MNTTDMPLRVTMCATCPFRHGSPYAHLAPMLAQHALDNSSRICHSTGSNAIHRRTGKASHLCRGARDVQILFMAGIKIIDAPTDEAWNVARVKCGMQPTIIKDP